METNDLLVLYARWKNTPDCFEQMGTEYLSTLWVFCEKNLKPGGFQRALLVASGAINPEDEEQIAELRDAIKTEVFRRDKKHGVQLMQQIAEEMERRAGEKETGGEEKAGKAATMPQQVLIFHYLFELAQIRDVDATEKARLIVFATGRNFKNVYDQIRNPLTVKDSKNLRKADLRAIRPYFEKLGIRGIVNMIDNELDKPDI